MKSLFAIAAALILLGSCTDESVTPSPDKQEYIYFLADTFNVQSREAEQYYCRMKEDGSERTRILRLWNNYASAYYSPDGANVILHSQIMNVDGTGKRYLFTGSNPHWSPDSRLLLYAVGNYVADSIFISALADEKPKFVAIDKGLRDIAWMPDSKKIIYSTGEGLLRIINSDGSGKTTLLKTDSLQITSLTAIGDKIIFYYQEPNYVDGGLGIVKNDGSDLRLIADFPYFTVNDISRDEKEILISLHDGKFYNLYTLNIETLFKRQITTFDNAKQINAQYSPDGTKILAGMHFVLLNAPSVEYKRIFSMNADGSGLKALSADTTRDVFPLDKFPGWGFQ